MFFMRSIQENTIFSLIIGTTGSFSKLLTYGAGFCNKKAEGTGRTTSAPSASNLLYL
jgi:hypothetical protein